MQERHAALELGQPSWLRDAQVAYITALATERDMKEQVFSQDFSKELPERQEMTIEDWGRRLEVRLRNFKKKNTKNQISRPQTCRTQKHSWRFSLHGKNRRQ